MSQWWRNFELVERYFHAWRDHDPQEYDRIMDSADEETHRALFEVATVIPRVAVPHF